MLIAVPPLEIWHGIEMACSANRLVGRVSGIVRAFSLRYWYAQVYGDAGGGLGGAVLGLRRLLGCCGPQGLNQRLYGATRHVVLQGDDGQRTEQLA